MYSASIHCIFSSDESDNMELEVSMRDSEGKDLSAYAASDDITTLLIDNRDCGGDPEHYEWETDWWEGEKDVYLIGVAPVDDIDLSTYWSVDSTEQAEE